MLPSSELGVKPKDSSSTSASSRQRRMYQDQQGYNEDAALAAALEGSRAEALQLLVPQHQTVPALEDDESFARAVQESLNLEHQDRTLAYSGKAQPTQRPSYTARAGQDTGKDEVLARQLQEELNSNSSAGTASMVEADLALARKLQDEPAREYSRRDQHHTSGKAPGQCEGCGSSTRWQPYVDFQGRRWHARCFQCSFCGKPIGPGPVWAEPSQPHVPYCSNVCQATVHNPCSVCGAPLTGTFGVHGFFSEERFCMSHREDGTPRCSSCERYAPRQEGSSVEVDEGSSLCLACLDTIVIDNQDAAPLYAEILRFYERQGLKLPQQPPLLMVKSAELGNAASQEQHPTSAREAPRRTGAAPVMHTRGLTLSEEHRQIRTVVRHPQQGLSVIGRVLHAVRPEAVDVVSRSHSEVTAILVQSGLPRLLTGSILAHEVMHAWLRYRHVRELSLDVEEGLCQLMASLWLDSQRAAAEQVQWDQRLLDYYQHQIATHSSYVYGEGFRGAHAAYLCFGLARVVDSVCQRGRLPDN